MKITGATALDSPLEGADCVPQDSAVCSAGEPVDLSTRDSSVKGQLFEDTIVKGSIDEGATLAEDPIFDVESALEGDEDLLDLLVETLDGDFDPNLLV